MASAITRHAIRHIFMANFWLTAMSGEPPSDIDNYGCDPLYEAFNKLHHSSNMADFWPTAMSGELPSDIDNHGCDPLYEAFNMLHHSSGFGTD